MNIDRMELIEVEKANWIPVIELRELVDQWLQRETGSEELDTLLAKGGYDWLARGLKTDLKNGISEASISNRESVYGSNKPEKVRLKSFFEHCKEALEDFIFQVSFAKASTRLRPKLRFLLFSRWPNFSQHL